MKRNEFFFKSKDNDTNIHMVVWEPEDKIYGILQVNHGLGDYILRYEEMATFLCKGGIVVVGIDLIGHGNSTNNGNKVMYFGGNGSYQNIVEDLNTGVDYVKQLYPGVPYAMLGYDIGSYFAQAYMINYGDKIDGTILVSPTYRSKFTLNGFKRKVDKEIKKLGDRNVSPKIEKILDKLKCNVNTKFDYLLKSEVKKQEYIVDSLKGENVTLGVYRDVVECMQYVRMNKVSDLNKPKPMCILYSTDDQLCNKGKDITTLLRDLQNENFSDVLVKKYDGIKHDILHEDNRYNIYNDIYGWLVTKLFRSIPMVQDQVLTNGVTAVDDTQMKLAQEHSNMNKQNNGN